MSEVSINSREKNRAPVTDFYRNQAFDDKSSDEDDLQTKLTFSIDRLLGSEGEPITDERKDRQIRMLEYSADIHGGNMHNIIKTYNGSEYCDQCTTQSLMLQSSIVVPSNYSSFISDNVDNFFNDKKYVERTSNFYCEYLNQDRDYQYSRLPSDSFDERNSKMILKPLPLRFGNGYCDLEVSKCNTQSVYSATVLSTGLPTIVERTSESDVVPYTTNSLTGLASIKALLHIEDFPSPSSSPLQCKTGLGHAVVSRRKRSWSRAVFSNLQRKGLERTFQDQKYITKPERKRLAANLGLHDAQVKVWFQNRRMKWRHMIKSTQLPLIPGSVPIIKGSSEGVTTTEFYSNINKICTLNINENIEDKDVTID